MRSASSCSCTSRRLTNAATLMLTQAHCFIRGLRRGVCWTAGLLWSAAQAWPAAGELLSVHSPAAARLLLHQPALDAQSLGEPL